MWTQEDMMYWAALKRTVGERKDVKAAIIGAVWKEALKRDVCEIVKSISSPPFP
jgi:hypothetical protein